MSMDTELDQVQRQVVQILGDAQLAGPEEKADGLAKAKELVMYKVPILLGQYLPILLEFQVDPASVVKERVLSIAVEAIQVAPCFAFLSQVTGCIRHLLNDSVPGVVRAAVTAARTLLSISLNIICWAPNDEENSKLAKVQWQALCGVLETVQTLISHSHGGVTMMTIKLMEQVVMMCSSPTCPPIKKGPPCRAFEGCRHIVLSELQRVTAESRGSLLKLARPSAVRSLSVNNQMVLLMALASIACTRPSFADDSVNALLEAVDSLRCNGSSGAMQSNGVLPRRQTPAQASLIKACGEALVVLLKCTSPSVMQHEERLKKGLDMLDMQSAALDAVKKRNWVLVRQKRAQERPSDMEPPATRQKIDLSVAPVQAAAHAARPDGPGGPSHAELASQVAEVRQLVATLLCERGMAGVLTFVDELERLQPGLLAEVIIATMSRLPAEPPAEGVSEEELLDLQRRRCAEALSPAAAAAPAAPAPAAAAAADPPPSPPAAPATPPGAAAASAQPAAVAKPPVIPRPAAAVLSDADALQMQQHAIRRILHAPSTMARKMRIIIVARLAPTVRSPEGHELLLTFRELLRSDAERALELALAWLYALFVRQCSLASAASDGASAGDPQPSTSARGAEEDGARAVVAADAYISALESLLDELFGSTDASARMANRLPPVTNLIAEVPLLLEGTLLRRLKMLCDRGAAWGKVALLTMRELIMSKHVRKPAVLKLAIEQLLAMRDAELQQSTVRMLANQVYPGLQEGERAEVEDAAVAMISEFPPPDAAAGGEGETPEFRENRARLCSNACQLLTSLCTKRGALLARFCEVYATAVPHMREAMLAGARQIGAMFSVDSHAVLSLVRRPPAGGEDVVVALLEGVLPKAGGIPSRPLVDACLEQYAASKDVRVLAQAMPGMAPSAALSHVPHLVKLAPGQFDATMRAIVAPHGTAPPLVQAVDVLVALHLARVEELNVTLKLVGEAVSRCIEMKDLFSRDAITTALSNLVQRQPLPPLIMRTMIHAYNAHVESRRYLVNTIAPQLLKRHIWVERVLWTGFIVFCSQSVPACFELMLQLPTSELDKCLSDPKMVDKGVRGKLVDYVQRQPNHGNLPKATLNVIGISS